ncbi:tRNA (cytidine(34)-2'-O)-methyltransferase [Nesterenkonia natronophila]|uniref:Putative tRNA (cytidine(34)-2'-O)-methyltransferase n=1 Tax=Nesterenkonia natronophila TaxID=2174932 RepID=A0A3A4F0T5_9MICC|nr:tRNA (cytidine(34)-2'-O)-methyltransferase [Nesterenkonia natronophila]RJN31802.1 tRNA (cytidine(34)-2'-O)-methyltransferase [Nesterenkonia natronophila]
MSGVGLRVVLDQPEIPGNTGNIIRLAAVTGFELHIAGPTLFDFSDTKLRRAGLDYHDLAVMTEHEHLEAAYQHLGITAPPTPGNSADSRVFAFTGEGTTCHTQISYRSGDTLLFGRESTGLDAQAKEDPRVSATVRIPMLPGRRSLNLANSVAVAVYEAWRQHGFRG